MPGEYSEPEGQILFASAGDQIAGVVAMRPIEDSSAAEMKRLYVREDWRGQGLGREFLIRIFSYARGKDIRRCGSTRCRNWRRPSPFTLIWVLRKPAIIPAARPFIWTSNFAILNSN